MALRLPRLTRGIRIVGKDGVVTDEFQRWWQSVVERIEDAVNEALEARLAADAASGHALGAADRADSALAMVAALPTLLVSLSQAVDAVSKAPRVEMVTTEPVLMMPREWKFNELGDIKVSVPVTRQVPVWDGQYWRNDLLALDDLSDVEIGTLVTRQYLIYNGTAGEWQNLDPVINDMKDVVNNTPSSGHILIYDAGATAYVNAAISSGSNITVTSGAGSISVGLNGAIVLTSVEAAIYDNTDALIRSTTALYNGAGAATATLNNSPTAGDPAKWLAVDDDGTTLFIPAWT